MSAANRILSALNETYEPKMVHPQKEQNILKIRTANQTLMEASQRPIPKMLFSEFWYEGELCFLFADTNAGKSILSVQIANSISKGLPLKGFILEAVKQKVLYFDFEMSDKQFEKRYSDDYKNHYPFDENFLRVEIDPDFIDFDDFERELFLAIEKAISVHEVKILIIDNLTYLKTQATETAKEALPLMKHLKQLKLKHNLSILALAHTPKRNLATLITRNDLAGSKHLANFADSMFAIGESCNDKNLRYFKQLKARGTEIIYDSENVAICELSKPDNFLGFELISYGSEKEHLKPPTENQKAELDAAIIELKKSDPLLSYSLIAERLNTNKMRVKRVLDRNVENPAILTT